MITYKEFFSVKLCMSKLDKTPLLERSATVVSLLHQQEVLDNRCRDIRFR